MVKRHVFLNDPADKVGIIHANLSRIKNNKINAGKELHTS